MAMMMSGGSEALPALVPCLPSPLKGQLKDLLLVFTAVHDKWEMNKALGLGMLAINSALLTYWEKGLKKKGLKKRVRQPSVGRYEVESAWKKPRLSNPLSSSKIVKVVGETIFDRQELVDGAGESKGGKAQQPDESVDPSDLAGEDITEPNQADQEASKSRASSEQSRSTETRVEEQEEVQSDENGEDLIRKGKEIFIQAFNWESHKQKWWRNLKGKVPELAAWGFSALWLPPFCDSLAPQGYLPKNFYNLNSSYGSEAELKSLLRHMKKSGVRSIADIVINHRVGSTRGVGDLYNRYDGMPMPWDEYAVTSDSGGLGNPSTGEIFNGIPNLDHSSEVVANDLKNWLQWLRKDHGFDGFRFDFAKGYSSKFVKDYIESSKPRLAVGEYWDTCNYVGPKYTLDYNQDAHRQRIVDWIDGTGGLACAFDFTTKAILQEACAKKEWYRLRDAQGRAPGLLGVWPSRAVTFIDNHDTGSTQAHWPFPREHVVQGYAYILTHPGQPCVFYDHLYEWGEDMKKAIVDLIKVRKAQDIHSRSSIRILEADARGYSAIIDKKVLIRIGATDWTPPEGQWEMATSGPGYMISCVVETVLSGKKRSFVATEMEVGHHTPAKKLCFTGLSISPT